MRRLLSRCLQGAGARFALFVHINLVNSLQIAPPPLAGAQTVLFRSLHNILMSESRHGFTNPTRRAQT
eukprot:319766-Rhodomonas_salina.11